MPGDSNPTGNSSNFRHTSGHACRPCAAGPDPGCVHRLRGRSGGAGQRRPVGDVDAAEAAANPRAVAAQSRLGTLRCGSGTPTASSCGSSAPAPETFRAAGRPSWSIRDVLRLTPMSARFPAWRRRRTRPSPGRRSTGAGTGVPTSASATPRRATPGPFRPRSSTTPTAPTATRPPTSRRSCGACTPST